MQIALSGYGIGLWDPQIGHFVRQIDLWKVGIGLSDPGIGFLEAEVGYYGM